jgi:hypothetical protein
LASPPSAFLRLKIVAFLQSNASFSRVYTKIFILVVGNGEFGMGFYSGTLKRI